MTSPLDDIPDQVLARLFDVGEGHDDGADSPWDEALSSMDANATLRVESPTPPTEPVVKTRRVGRGGEADLDYETGALIGQGGGGRVFEARQVSANRTVALKRLLPELADMPARRARFLKEALLAAGFDHPNLLPIYDVGIDQDGQPFLVMPRVEGVPWSRTIRERSRSENLAVLAKLADAAAHLHSRGVIHRDLKPANVLLGPSGEVLLADWGLAIRLPDPGKKRGLPPGVDPGGTPAYMPPEMARDERTLIGFASDVYLLGAILHEILTDAPPHAAPDAAQALLDAKNRPYAGTVESGRPGRLLRAALSADPVRRPAATEFAATIRKMRRGKRKMWLWASLVLGAITGAGFYLARGWSNASMDSTPPVQQTETTFGRQDVQPGAVMTGLSTEETKQLLGDSQHPDPP